MAKNYTDFYNSHNGKRFDIDGNPFITLLKKSADSQG